MSRIRDIILRARDVLADPDGDRWDDDALLRKLNEGMYDIAIKAEAFRASYSIQLIQGIYIYQLPADLIKIRGVLFGQRPIPIHLAQQMDRIKGHLWRTHSSEHYPEAVVTDRQDSLELRVYPRPFADDIYDTGTFDPNTLGVSDEITEFTFDSNLGLVGTLLDYEVLDINNAYYGIISDIVEGDFLTIEYARRPIKAQSVAEDPELPEAFDTALVRYITGTALRDDINAQNRSMGNEELTLYQNELDMIANVSKQEQTSIAHNNTSEYRGIG